MFVIRLITLPFRLAFGSARLGWRTGRLIGPGRAVTFGLGIGAGVLLASPEARRTARASVQALADGWRGQEPKALPAATEPTPATE